MTNLGPLRWTAVGRSSTESEEQPESTISRVSLFQFFFGNSLKLVGAILVIASLVLGFSPSLYVGFGILLPVLLSGVACWIVGAYKAKVPIPNIPVFVAVVVVVAVTSFLVFTGWGFYLFQLPSGSYVSILVGVPGILLGVAGAFVSMVNERAGGILLTVGALPALSLGILGDPSISPSLILWWSVPLALGLLFVMKKRALIRGKFLASMGFASCLLPWFTGWEWDWYPNGAQTHFFNYFLFGIVLRDADLQFFGYLLYFGLIPLALVVAGSTTFLSSLVREASAPTRRKRSVQSGIILIAASAISGTILLIISVVLQLIGGRYSQIEGLASAGCWLALLTGTIMAAPLSFNISQTRLNPPPVEPTVPS